MAGRCYVYAILGRGTVLPSLSGFGPGVLAAVPWGQLAAAVSWLSTTEVPSTPERVLLHENIVETLCSVGPALPVRFGTILANAGAVENALAERYAVLLKDLSRLGDKVELGVTVLWGATEAAVNEMSDLSQETLPFFRAVGPGTRYLQARFIEIRREENLCSRSKELANMLDRKLICHAIEGRASTAPTSSIPLRANYLLEQSKVVPFRKALDEIRGEYPALRFLLSGPWPPYSFVTSPGSS